MQLTHGQEPVFGVAEVRTGGAENFRMPFAMTERAGNTSVAYLGTPYFRGSISYDARMVRA